MPNGNRIRTARSSLNVASHTAGVVYARSGLVATVGRIVNLPLIVVCVGCVLPGRSVTTYPVNPVDPAILTHSPLGNKQESAHA